MASGEYSFEHLLEKIREKISDETYGLLYQHFIEMEQLAIKEEDRFNKNNFLARYKVFKKIQDLKKPGKCKCKPNELCVFDKFSLLNCKNFNDFSKVNPLIMLLYDVKVCVPLETSLEVNLDVKNTQYLLMNLIRLADAMEDRPKFLACIMIIDFALKNIFMLVMDKSVGYTILSIYEHFCENSDFIKFMNDYDLSVEKFRHILRMTVLK